MGHAASLLLGAMARAGSPLIQSLAETISEGDTSKKGRQERISGWLARYDFARPIATWLWNAAQATIGRDTVIALDGATCPRSSAARGWKAWKKARVWTFLRLQNLVALCALAHVGLAHFLPGCPEMAKAMKENFAAINQPFRAFVANLRVLWGMSAIRFISDRPSKRGPPVLPPLLPGFSD